MIPYNALDPCNLEKRISALEARLGVPPVGKIINVTDFEMQLINRKGYTLEDILSRRQDIANGTITPRPSGESVNGRLTDSKPVNAGSNLASPATENFWPYGVWR